MIRLRCPACNKLLSVSDDRAGKASKCPACGKRFRAPAPSKANLSPTASQPAVIPDPPSRATLIAAASNIALTAKIGLQEEAWKTVDDVDAAGSWLEDCKKRQPAVPSAYRPSSVAPEGSTPLLFLGGMTGALSGALAGLACAGAGLLVNILLVTLVIGTRYQGRGTLMIIALTLVFAAATFAALGATSTWTVIKMNVLSRNRNPKRLMLAAMAATVLAIILFWLVVPAILTFHAGGSGESLAALVSAAIRGIFSGWIVLSTFVIGGILALVIAAAMSTDALQKQPFCEKCSRYLRRTALRELSFGGTRLIAAAVNQGDLVAAAGATEIGSGGGGKPVLYVCPICSRGQLDVTLHLGASYPWDVGVSSGTTGLNDSWLVVSRVLTADDVRLFTNSTRE